VSFQQLMDEDRRLCILRCLSEADGGSLNEDLLLRLVEHFRLGVLGPDELRGYVTWLEGQRLVEIEKLKVPAGDLWVAKLTATGLSVAKGRKWPGVAQPALR
jgi:hypothetical protein